jgi:hypothetical protein
MPSTEIDRGARRVRATARRDDELIARAAKCTDLAGTALASAAVDLRKAHSCDGNDLAGLAELVLDQAGRISHLVEDIESHRAVPEDDEPGGDL